MEKWINKALTTVLVVIFRSLFKEEILQTIDFFSFSTF